jgi:hypothetical protein
MERIEEITLNVKLKNCMKPDGTGGIMHFKIADSCARLMDGDTQIAEIAGCVGGTLEISCRGQTFAIGAKEIWNAVCEQFGESPIQ